MKLKAGQPAIPFATQDVHGNPISLADFAGKWLLVEFLRFVTCPRCGLRLYSLTLQYPTLQARGLSVITFVESSRDDILQQSYAREAPFPIIADPDETMYKLYGVKNSRFGLFLGGKFRKQEIREAHQLGFGTGPLNGNDYRMPADFLITPQQTVQIAHYGRDSGDTLTFQAIERALPQLTAVAS